MPRRRADRIGLLFLGMVLGFALTVFALFLFVRSTQRQRTAEQVQVALGLPREAFELERVYPDGALRIMLRRVAFLDPQGDTIVSAPQARATLDARSMSGTGPIVVRDAEVIRPYLRLAQNAAGEWNALGIVAVEADGAPVGGEDAPAGRTIQFRGIRIVDGRARIAVPMEGPPQPPTGRFASLPQPETVRQGGTWMRISWLEDLDATLPLVRVGGSGGWRAEIGSASARVRNPDTRIENLAGWLEDRGNQVIRFELRELRTPYSRFAGAGAVRVPEDGDLRYDVRLAARPLDFRDLAGMGFPVPGSGTATFDLGILTLEAGRTRWSMTDAQFAVLGSRASGRLTAVTGPGIDPQFSDTRLLLDPLRLEDLETLGYADELPVTGTVRGTIASVGTVDAGGGPLRLDLAATLGARGDPGAPESTLTVAGPVRWRAGSDDPIVFDGLRVEASPLYLGTLAALAPENAALMRGTLRGGATLTGSLGSFRLAGGDLAYQVGSAPESRLRGVTGQVTLGPPLSYTLRGRAEPLALATLTELFPALPFRAATLAGPITVTGNGDDVSFDVDLEGAAGAVAARGSLTLGEVPRFDVSGTLEAFRPGSVVTGDVPVEGPLTGTFSARGTTQNLRFATDFAMEGGRLTLGGTYGQAGAGLPPNLDVTGRADNFRIGAVLGRPDLLPDPVTGPIRLAGGGRQPYRFDVDLRGELGRLDLEGSFRPGTVPEYTVRGQVVGLDLSALPGGAVFPTTRLNGTLELDGRGTTPQTFTGRVDFRADPGSTVGRFPLEAGLARFEAADGILRVDTLAFAARNARFHAAGQFGLTRPAPEPLRFSLQVPDLAALRPIVPGGDTLPELGGALGAAGYLSGTFENPTIAARGDGRGLRYGRYAARTLAFDVDLTRTESWTGTAKLEGTELQLGPAQRLASLRLETTLAQGSAAFSFAARRDDATDVAAAGTLEMDGLAPRAAIFDALALRLSGTEWRLGERARLAWGMGGLAVENFRLRRVDGQGYVEADGTLPERGVADLRVRAAGVDLADVSRLLPGMPALAGRLAADASIVGPVAAPQMRLDLRVDSLSAGGVTSDRLVLAGRYDDRRMDLTGDLTFAGRRVLDIRAAFPMLLSLDGAVPAFELIQDGPVTGALVADSLPLALLASAAPTVVSDAEGVIRGQVDVVGTVRSPEVSGFGMLTGGALTMEQLGVRWTGVNGAMSLQGEVVRLDSLVARTGSEGIARASGTVRLDDTRRPQVDVVLVMDDFQVIDKRELAEMRGDANLALRGRLPSPVLTGEVRLNEGTIYIPEAGAQAEGDILAADIGALGADTVTAPTAGAVLLANMIARDLTVSIGDEVWLQSPDARIQITGEVLVERSSASALPVLYGDLEAVRGSYNLEIGFLSREFEIASGRVQFFGTPEMNPALDIVAVHEVRSPDATTQEVTVQVNITGTLQNPVVQLSAGGTRQPLSESEVASLLLFGRTGASGGGAYDVLQAQLQGEFLVGYLTGPLVSILEETLIRSHIVDYVRIRTRPAGVTAFATAAGYTSFLSTISVELGREIINDVFATVEIANVFQQPQMAVSLDWDITSTLSLRAANEPTRRDPTFRDLQRSLNLPRRQNSVDLRWRFEYGRPPPQDPVIPKPTREPAPGQPSTPDGQPPPPPPTETPTPR